MVMTWMKRSKRCGRTLVPAALAWLLLVPLASAQPVPGELFGGMQARSIGPANMSGRIAAIDAVNAQPEIMYVGAATGGVWKTVNGGTTWTPIFDDQRDSSIGAVAVFQPNPEIVWVGAGEGNPRNSAGVGRGVYRSIDGGKTWKSVGLEKTERIHKLILHPTNPEIAYAAAMGTTWGENPERGVYKTADGGKTWNRVLFVDERTGVSDLAIDPANPNRLIASMWEHRRWPWFFKSGGPGSGLYQTTDGGTNWRKLTPKEGIPEGELGRIGLAFARNNPKVVYALIEAKRNVLMRSDDSGTNWKAVNQEKNVSPRPFYFSDIAVSPTDENTIYRMANAFDVSTDGGKTFKPVTRRSVLHGDHHVLWIHPNGKLMANGNDGGMGISLDQGKKWRFIDNLPVAQFYRISADLEVPYNVSGGLQDNGSWRGPSAVLKGGALMNAHWESVGIGDGFFALTDPDNPDYGYSTWQGGNLIYFSSKLGMRKSIRPTESDVKHRYNWNAAFAFDPFDKKAIYYGSQFVHVSRDKGQSWQILSPDLTTNNPEKQNQAQSGGLTLDATAAENHCSILSIAPSPLKRGVLWAGTDDGNLQVTTDGGKTWTRVSDSLVSSGLVPAESWVSHVEASKFDPATAFVTIDDHRRANWQTYVLVTRDYGKTWENLATAEIDGFAHVIEQDPVNKDLLFVGTEFGLYVTFNGGKNWTKWTQGLPTVPVTDVLVHPREHDLVIGTHGRGAYIIDDIRPLRTVDALASKDLHLFSIADSEQYLPGQGGIYNNPGDALFTGTNRSVGALLTYMANPAPGTAKDAKLDIEILDRDSKLVRLIQAPLKAGVNRVNWDLRRRAFEAPALTNEPEPMDQKVDPATKPGILVLPGRYTARIRYNGKTVSQAFEVKSDPRLAIKPEDRRRNYELSLRIGALIENLNTAHKQLASTRQAVQALDKTGTPDTSENKTNLAEKLQFLSNSILEPDPEQGIQRNPTGLTQQLNVLLNTLQSSFDAPTEAVLVRFAKLEKQSNALLTEVQTVYKTE